MDYCQCEVVVRQISLIYMCFTHETINVPVQLCKPIFLYLLLHWIHNHYHWLTRYSSTPQLPWLISSALRSRPEFCTSSRQSGRRLVWRGREICSHVAEVPGSRPSLLASWEACLCSEEPHAPPTGGKMNKREREREKERERERLVCRGAKDEQGKKDKF